MGGSDFDALNFLLLFYNYYFNFISSNEIESISMALFSCFFLLFAFPLIRGEATSAVYHGEKLLNGVIKVLDVLKLKDVPANTENLPYDKLLSCLTPEQYNYLNKKIFKGCDDQVHKMLRQRLGPNEQFLSVADCAFKKSFNFSSSGVANTTSLKKWVVDLSDIPSDKSKMVINSNIDLCMNRTMKVTDEFINHIVVAPKVNKEVTSFAIYKLLNGNHELFDQSQIMKIKRFYNGMKALICTAAALLRNGCNKNAA